MSGLRFGLSLSMQGTGGKGWRDYDLFANGENGFLLDFSRADALFQEATGITPAGVDQNVGLALDVSKWGGKTLAQVLAGQAELITNGNFDANVSGWSAQGSGGTTFSWVSGAMQIVRSGSAAGLPGQTIATVAGRFYWMTAKNNGPGAATWRVGGANAVSIASGATVTRIIAANGASTLHEFWPSTDPDTVAIDVVSVKEIPGNHASQATSGARPVLKAGGLTRYDGSDDNLLTTLVPSAAMTLAVKFVNSTAARVAIGASTTAPRNYLGISNLGGTIGGGVGDQNWDVIRSPSGDDRNNLIIGVLTASAADGVRIYRNAVQVYAGALSGTPAGSLPFRIGASNSGSGAAAFLFGDIYQALAINRALTPAEVLKLTNAWSH